MKMRKLLGRITAAVLSAVFAVSLTPAAGKVQAADQSSIESVTVEEVETYTGSATYVNPMYADYINLETSGEENESTFMPDMYMAISTYDTTAYMDYTDFIDISRKHMIDRDTNFTIRFRTPSRLNGNEHANQMIADICNDYSSSVSGDYLYYHFQSLNAKWSYFYSDGYYYNEATYTVGYWTTATQEAALTKALNTTMKSLELDGKSDYEKAKRIYDHVVAQATYDNEAVSYLNNNSVPEYYKYAWSAYGVEVKNRAVCQGYASLFYRMAFEAGLSVRTITGIGNGGNHAWNIVKVGDYYYNIDATWDSCVGAGSRYYFLLNEKDFTDHSREDKYRTAAFYRDYPMAPTSFNPATDNHGIAHIEGICQMPYWGEGGGYLIGVETNQNPGQQLSYELLILDCTLLAEGKPAWVWTTGKCNVGDGNAFWAVWQPEYGYYWTLFRIYDQSGRQIDELCYGFQNIY